MKHPSTDPSMVDDANDERDWSEGERQMLARVRAARSQRRVPDEVKQRVLARLRAPARPSRPSSPPLPTLGQLAQAMPTSYREVWVAAPLAAVFAVLVAVRALGWTEPLGAWLGIGAEGPRRDGAQPVADLPLFRKAAIRLQPGAARGPDLFQGKAFQEGRGDWQVRNWDLRTDPAGEARHDLSGGTLCVEPKDGVPVLGAWPWLSEEKAAKATATGRAEHLAREPLPQVFLRSGQRYRLTLSAWATRPAESRLLVAVGHAAPPYSAASGSRVELAAEPKVFGMDFVAEFDDPHVGVAFLASTTPGEPRGRVCVRDLRLTLLP